MLLCKRDIMIVIYFRMWQGLRYMYFKMFFHDVQFVKMDIGYS